jgi:hypothetical protein
MPPIDRGRARVATQKTGPTGRSVACTATVTALIVADASGNRRGAARTYRLKDLPQHIRAQIDVDALSGCWVTKRTDKDGYGRIGAEGAHRVVWKLLVSEIPAGLVLDHRDDWGCLSKACCYPRHLKMTTHRENVLRGTSFAAVNAAKTECEHGHPFDLFNTYIRPNGNRDCRACIRDRVAKYQRGLREARQSDLARAA